MFRYYHMGFFVEKNNEQVNVVDYDVQSRMELALNDTGVRND